MALIVKRVRSMTAASCVSASPGLMLRTGGSKYAIVRIRPSVGVLVFAFTESVEVSAEAPRVWAVMTDVEQWWPASNPDHMSLELLDWAPLALGSRMRIRERVAGIPADATGSITEFEEGSRVTWEAAARYKLLGLPLHVQEGVTWTIEPRSSATTRISARVWATLPLDHLTAPLFRALGGVQKDREHARTELLYLKNVVEAEPNGS